MRLTPNSPILPPIRLVPRRRKNISVRHPNSAKAFVGDFYAQLLGAHWGRLLIYIGVVYFLANVLFATLYMSVEGGIENARPGSFQDAFFFSVQTMATIGYGKMVPVGVGANILVALEALFGFAFFAVVMGLAFSKLSRPTARLLFSDVAVIGPYDGKQHLMMRVANARGNRIVDANVQLVILRDEVTKEGKKMRRFTDLRVVRDRVPFLQYSWTVLHCIDENSPLYGISPQSLQESQSEIILSLIGLDDTFAQTVHTRHSYIGEEIRCNAVFQDVLSRENGRIEVNFAAFHDTLPLTSEPALVDAKLADADGQAVIALKN